MKNINDISSDLDTKNQRKVEVPVVKESCQKSPTKALKFGSKIDTQSHLVSNYNNSSVRSHDILRHSDLNLAGPNNNLDHVTSHRDYNSRVKIDCQAQPKLKTELQVMFDKIRNKRLSRIMDEIDPKSMNLNSRKVINSPTYGYTVLCSLD